MPPPLKDNMVEYEDGTAATVPQMAKDICCFLFWAQLKRWDELYSLTKKIFTVQAIWFTTAFWYYRRLKACEMAGSINKHTHIHTYTYTHKSD